MRISLPSLPDVRSLVPPRARVISPVSLQPYTRLARSHAPPIRALNLEYDRPVVRAIGTNNPAIKSRGSRTGLKTDESTHKER